MADQFDRIKDMYGDSFRRHGDSPASLLTPKGRNALRFRAIDPFVQASDTRVLDYGCGLAYLLDHLEGCGCNVRYTGIDILPEFVEACAMKHPHAEFRQLSPDGALEGSYDVVFASGVFNLRTHDDLVESKAYVFDRVAGLFALAQDVLICDFLSSNVDFQQPDAQHFSVGEIAEFCAKGLGRRFQIRHDLLPYEFTLVVWKDDSIKRPENVFEVDG